MAFYIPALVIRKNNTVFISTAGISVQKSGGSDVVTGVGLSTEIPTAEAGAVPDSDYWATPVGEGILTGFIYQAYNANDPIGSIAPTVQSFKVCRIMNLKASDYWYIVGTVAQYIAADGGSALPTTITTLPAAYQKMCEFDENGKYFAIFSLPPLIAPNDRYFPFGYFNNAALPAGANAGYITSAALLTFLNANWTNLGSPVTGITWTVSADGITLRGEEANGGGTDIIAAQIAAINPSL